MNLENVSRWAVVTGASGGLGRAFALELSRRGHPVVLVARRREQLELLAREIESRGGGAEVVVADLSKADGVNAVVTTAARLGGVEILVNNAGFGSFGPLLGHPAARELDEVALNIGAVVALTRAL